jgi:outer membrane protein assembly factor BamB
MSCAGEARNGDRAHCHVRRGQCDGWPHRLGPINAKTGEQIYRNRLNVGATIDASPLLADGKLYITGENAATVVLAAGPEYKELARNELDGSWTMSSIAVCCRATWLSATLTS